MKTNKAKIQAWRKTQRDIATQTEAIAKAIRRHYGMPHAFKEWGAKVSILRAIHKEIAPQLELRRAAQDFLYYGQGKQRKQYRNSM